jgi:hypothetical protein
MKRHEALLIYAISGSFGCLAMLSAFHNLTVAIVFGLIPMAVFIGSEIYIWRRHR